MKKIVLVMVAMVMSICFAAAQNVAKIEFDKTTHDFGTFSESDALKTCTFTFTNTGTGPLVIIQAVASCGCTVAKYTEEPVQPGKTGTVTITYDGKGKVLGPVNKSVTLRTNAEPEMVRLYIKGTMTPKED